MFTRQVVLAVWSGMHILMMLYVLGSFRMEHDSPIESVGAARVTVAIVFLAVTIWLAPGLFGRQLGEFNRFFRDSVSPPDRSGLELRGLATRGRSLNDYDGAIQQANRRRSCYSSRISPATRAAESDRTCFRGQKCRKR